MICDQTFEELIESARCTNCTQRIVSTGRIMFKTGPTSRLVSVSVLVGTRKKRTKNSNAVFCRVAFSYYSSIYPGTTITWLF